MSGGARTNLRPRAAILVASGEQYQVIARQLGLNERTVRRWAKDGAFAAEVKICQSRVVREAATRLSDGLLSAAKVLVKMLEHDDPRLRLSAARTIMAVAPAMREQQIVEERLDLLEAQASTLSTSQEPIQ